MPGLPEWAFALGGTYIDAGAWKKMLRAWVTPTPLMFLTTPRATSGKDAQLGVCAR